MNEIFISYRQDDAKGSATLVHDLLVRAFGQGRVFLDKDSLAAGDWRDKIHLALDRCKVFVVVIGKQWLTISNAEGTPRLHLPDDTHAEEIALALARPAVLVIPLRLEGAPDLDPQKLPDSLRMLVRRQILPLADDSRRREIDVDRLVAAIERHCRIKALPGWKAGEAAPRVRRLPTRTDAYLAQRGPFAHQDFTGGLSEPPSDRLRTTTTVQELRARLLRSRFELKRPVPIQLRGTLFPAALLSSGWWEQHGKAINQRIRWRDSVQEWLFHGFELWGPSWDFSWDFDEWDRSRERPHFIAQLGDGDEANSIPVLIPQLKARRLQEALADQRWGGIEAEVSGVLGHRHHFARHVNEHAFELFGGLLDFCIWIDADNNKHVIQPLGSFDQTAVYSGYLWKCVAPKQFLKDKRVGLHDVWFVWEHTNFASREAVSYNLDSLERKEEYIRRQWGDLVLVQKSSFLVPGTPQWRAEEVYELLLNKKPLPI